MSLRLFLTSYLVTDYDAAIAWFVDRLGFILTCDEPLTDAKRWVVVTPPSGGCGLLLAKADGATQERAVGHQAGGRVCMFLETDDFARDHAAFIARGVRFCEEPRQEPYGIVAVFEDLYDNRWDLIEHRPPVQSLVEPSVG